MDPKYRIVEQLGQGGSARVFLAVSGGIGGFLKLFVLKIPRKELVRDETSRNAFLAEARLSARLSHPNIVEVYEVFEDEGVPVIVMQYLDGPALSELRRVAGRKLDLATHIEILEKTLAGLHHAHELTGFNGTPLQVVHRDVSPHNVVLTYSGEVKVLDFGIAKLSASSDTTETGGVKGKLTYMAPEQVVSGQLDRRADIYCVGIMLWEAVTGRRFWDNIGEQELLGCLFSGAMPQATSGPDIPPELGTVLKRALAYRAQDRYATAAEFAAQLRCYRESLPEPRVSLPNLLQELFSEQRRARQKHIEQRLADGPRSNCIGARPISVPAGMMLHPNDGREDETLVERPYGMGQTRSQSDVTQLYPETPKHAWWRSRLALVAATLAGTTLAFVPALRGSDKAEQLDAADSNMASPAGTAIAAGSSSPETAAPQSVAGLVPEPVGHTPVEHPCTKIPVAHGKKLTIDDFNKIDQVIDTYDSRNGEWYSFHDGSNLPPQVSVTHLGLSLALHVVGGPYSSWGGGVGAELNAECPYDASIHHGIRVVARGVSPTRLKVLTTENVVAPLGICPAPEEQCHDIYQAELKLKPDEWTVFDVPWEQLTQRGFGRQFKFDPARINHVQFEWIEQLPIDAWIDYVGFF